MSISDDQVDTAWYVSKEERFDSQYLFSSLESCHTPNDIVLCYQGNQMYPMRYIPHYLDLYIQIFTNYMSDGLRKEYGDRGILVQVG